MRMLLIEESSPGRYRLANGPMTVEVFGSSVEEVLVQAMQKLGITGVFGSMEITSTYAASEVLDSLMGKPEPVSWNQNGAEVEGWSV